MFLQRRIEKVQFKTTPEVLLMDSFPPDEPWSIRQESAGLCATAKGRERCFTDFRAALCWVAVQLGVPVL